MDLPGYDRWKTREPDWFWHDGPKSTEEFEEEHYLDKVLGWCWVLGLLDDGWEGWEPDGQGNQA